MEAHSGAEVHLAALQEVPVCAEVVFFSRSWQGCVRCLPFAKAIALESPVPFSYCMSDVQDSGKERVLSTMSGETLDAAMDKMQTDLSQVDACITLSASTCMAPMRGFQLRRHPLYTLYAMLLYSLSPAVDGRLHA